MDGVMFILLNGLSLLSGESKLSASKFLTLIILHSLIYTTTSYSFCLICRLVVSAHTSASNVRSFLSEQLLGKRIVSTSTSSCRCCCMTSIDLRSILLIHKAVALLLLIHRSIVDRVVAPLVSGTA